MTAERKRINYQCLLNGRDLLMEIDQIQKNVAHIKDEYYWEIYREIEQRVIDENGVKVIYLSPTA